MTERAKRPPRTDQHMITTDQVVREHEGEKLAGWTAFCSCGWASRVLTEYEDLAIQAARKHADWAERPIQRRNIQVNVSVKANEIPDSDAIRELVKAVERGAP